MIIDFHTHVGDLRNRRDEAHEPITWENLIARLDEEGIDQAVLLPVCASPEGTTPGNILLDSRMSIRDQVIDAGQCADRLIPFGNIDPRWMDNDFTTDFSVLLDWFQSHGCKGIGEVTASLPYDDPRVINLFRQCGERGLPVTVHARGLQADHYGLQDEWGMARLERLLQSAEETIVVGHGIGFWAEISDRVSPRQQWPYPEGPIGKEGALWRLMRAYPNLYADLSAMSGYNAISRDPEAGFRFLVEFQDKLLFGTDVCFADDLGRMPHLSYLRQILSQNHISDTAFGKITAGNAQRLLGLV